MGTWFIWWQRKQFSTLCVSTSIVTPLDDQVFVDRWAGAISRFSGQVNKGFNSIILGAWLVWKHCNYCVFDGGIPNLSWVLLAFREEAQQWSVAGA